MGRLRRIAELLPAMVFVGFIIETFGLLVYLLWTDERALDAFMAGGFTPGELGAFLAASPDRLLVAAGLALLSVLMVLGTGSRAASTPHHHHE